MRTNRALQPTLLRAQRIWDIIQTPARPFPAFGAFLPWLFPKFSLRSRCLFLRPGPLRSRLDALCVQFKGFDQNHDGQAEIQELVPLAGAGKANQRVIMLVEDRLLKPLDGAAELKPLLERWANDASADGYRADVISVKLAPSKLHQDGRYVLALREFLRAADRETKLAGVVLVGHFPDALLVRTCNWRKSGDITLHRGTPQEKAYKGVPYLRRVPEPVAQKADIVLSDLDGRWEDVYVQPKRR